MHKRVIYLCESFPVLSETFISDQVEQLLAADVPVQVLSLFEGRNAALNARWRADSRRDAALTTLYRDRQQARSALIAPWLVLRLLLRPASWAITLRCALQARGALRDAVFYAGWLSKHPQRADVLVCHFGPIGYLGALLRAWGLISAQQVTVFHGYDMSRVIQSKGRGFYRPLFRDDGHHSLAITRHWQALLRSIGDAAPSWVPLGVDTTAVAFRPRPYPEHGPIRLITVGRLTAKKGQADTLRALAQLPADQPWSGNWEYHLVGTGPDEAELKALAASLGLQERVIFHGGLPHAKTLELLETSDVFVLTSKTAADGDMEGLPIALMEALASGMPTLSTRHSGIPELITHLHNGLLCDEGDVQGLRDNLAMIMAEPQLWGRLVIAGRETVERQFDLPTNAQTFARFLDDVCEGRPLLSYGEAMPAPEAEEASEPLPLLAAAPASTTEA